MEYKRIEDLNIAECLERLKIKRGDIKNFVANVNFESVIKQFLTEQSPEITSEIGSLVYQRLVDLLQMDRTSFKSCHNLADYQSYMSKNIDGLWREEAELEIKKIEGEQLTKTIINNNQKAEKEIVSLKKSKAVLIILLILIIGGCGVALFFLDSTKSGLEARNKRISILNSTIESMEEEISELKLTVESMDGEIKQEKERYSILESEIASVVPFVITRVEMGSAYKGGDIETSFGSTLYQNRVRFLTPLIYYKCFISGSYNLKTKLYNPDGSLRRNSEESPYGYTQSKDYYLSKGSNTKQMNGWGYESPGNYSSGTYKIEIWYNEKCLFVKSFTIQ